MTEGELFVKLSLNPLLVQLRLNTISFGTELSL